LEQEELRAVALAANVAVAAKQAQVLVVAVVAAVQRIAVVVADLVDLKVYKKILHLEEQADVAVAHVQINHIS